MTLPPYDVIVMSLQIGEDNKLLIRVHYGGGASQTYQVNSKFINH